MGILASALIAFMATTQSVQASSPDAWEEFQLNVRDACTAASSGVLQVVNIQVDPYGSESYGFAVLFGFETGNPQQRMLVCAFDKKTQIAEISAPFDP